MKIASDAFMIDKKYSMINDNLSIPISIEDISSDAKSIVVLFHDLDLNSNQWVHWIMVDIPVTTTCIKEGVSKTINIPDGSIELKNSFGNIGYDGPCPPESDDAHEYELSIFVMKTEKLDMSKLLNLDTILTYTLFTMIFLSDILSEYSISSFFKTDKTITNPKLDKSISDVIITSDSTDPYARSKETVVGGIQYYGGK